MEPRNCPYIAVLDDTKSCKNFPYEGHACHRAKKPVSVKLSYQRSHCLNEAYTQCPGYINGWETGFPKFLRADYTPGLNVLLNKLQTRKEQETDQEPVLTEPKTEHAPVAAKTEKTPAIKEVQKKRDWSKALAASFTLFKGKIHDGIKSLGAKLKSQKETGKKPSFIKSLQSKLSSFRVAKKEEKAAGKPLPKPQIIVKEEKRKVADRTEIIMRDAALSDVQRRDLEKRQEKPKEAYLKPVPDTIPREKLDLRKEYNLRDELKSQRHQKKSLKIELPWQKNQQPEKDRKGLLPIKRTKEKTKQNKADGLNFFQRVFSRKKAQRKVNLKKVFRSKTFMVVSLLIVLIVLFATFPGQILTFGRDVRSKVDGWFTAGMGTIEAILATNTPGVPTETLSPSIIAEPSITTFYTQTLIATLTPPGSGTPGIAPFIYLTKTEAPEP